MKETVEYEIYIGCNDPQTGSELVSQEELRETVLSFFERNHTDFSLLNTHGGYLYRDGSFIMEDSLCINIVGDSEMNIIKLAQNLVIFMNQENALVVRSSMRAKIR